MSSLSKSEKSYIQSSLLSTPPHRADGRSLTDYRLLDLQTGIEAHASGSARVAIGVRGSPSGGSGHSSSGATSGGGGGGTVVLAATRLEVETIDSEDDASTSSGNNEGRVVCSVTCTSTAYPHLSAPHLEDLQADLSNTLHQALSHPSVRPSNLTILPHKKSWILNVDVAVLADDGNVLDAIFIAARAAMWDTKIPRTRGVEYRREGTKKQQRQKDAKADDMDTTESNFDVRRQQTAADFELVDYWDEGEPLRGREALPICVTLNVISPIHFLDATLPEESSTPLRILFLFSFPSASENTRHMIKAEPASQVSNAPAPAAYLQAMRTLGTAEIKLDDIEGLISEAESYARSLLAGLEGKLREEERRRNEGARARFERMKRGGVRG